MIRLGLLGKSIQHSKSKNMYENILKCNVEYTLFDYENENMIPDLKELFNRVEGLSITAPYKEYFFNSVALSDEARLVGAINCIKRDGNSFKGFNTDFLACRKLILDYGISNSDSIVVLGNGPMARMILILLKDYLNDIFHVFRTSDFQINSFDFDSIKSNNVTVINCCSRGVVFSPDFKGRNVSKFWDMNYSQDHLFSKLYPNCYIDGLDLLNLQAKFALQIWGIK